MGWPETLTKQILRAVRTCSENSWGQKFTNQIKTNQRLAGSSHSYQLQSYGLSAGICVIPFSINVLEQEDWPHRADEAWTNQNDGKSSAIANINIGNEPACLCDCPEDSRDEARQDDLLVYVRFVAHICAINQEINDRRQKNATKLIEYVIQPIWWCVFVDVPT